MFKNLNNITTLFNQFRAAYQQSCNPVENLNKKQQAATPTTLSSLYFTQSELQQIKEVIRNRINLEEKICKIMQVNARNRKLEGDKVSANMYYNDVVKIKKKIKSLSEIQAKVKHSILTFD